MNKNYFFENSRISTHNEAASPLNLQPPQNSQSGFARKNQKFRTVTFSNMPLEEKPRSHFFIDKSLKTNETPNEEQVPSPPESKEYKGKNAFLYNYLQDFLHFTLGRDDDEDLHHKIEEETHLKKELTEIPQLFRQHTKITNKRRPDFLKVTHMNKIEKVFVDYDSYPDKYPFKKTRKFMILSWRYTQSFAKSFGRSAMFEILSLIVILMNCVTYILKQNRTGEYLTYLDTIYRFEFSFLVFYIIEMSFKMIALGLFFEKSSYFRDGWNILDFFVILNLVLLNYNVTAAIINDYSLLRIIRLLRPLRALTKFHQLRAIISSLFAALPLLLDFLTILLFFFLIYAALGLHLFAGLLMYRCMNVELGNLYLPETVCGNLQCPENSLCMKGMDNLQEGVVSFDNLLASLLQVMFISTLDNWTVTMYNIQRAFTNYAWIYFVSLVIFGNYILLNLTLALIKVKFSETHDNLKNEKKTVQKSIQTYDFMDIKRQGLWISKRKEDPIEVKPKISNQISVRSHQNEEDEIKENKEENLSEEKKIIRLFKDANPINFKESKNPSILKPGSFFAGSNSGKRRRGANAVMPASFASSKSKTFKSSKSQSHHSSSLMTKKNRKEGKFSKISNSKNSKIEGRDYYSSESMLSFISMDDSRPKLMRSISSNKCLSFLFRIFGRVVKFIPYRRHIKHQTIFHLEPKYLKLIVNFEKDYKSMSEEDILPTKDQVEKVKQMMMQMNLIKKKKLPIIYAPKKKKASLLKFLRQVYSKKFGSSRGNTNTKTKEVVMLSSRSDSSMGSFEERIFKSFAAKKGIAVKPTKRFSKDKRLSNLTSNSENRIANELENYVVNLNDLFRTKDESSSSNLKEKNNLKAKVNEKIRKKLDNMLSHKNKQRNAVEPSNYIWMRNLINQNIEEEKDDEKDSIEHENLQSVDMAKKYLEIRKKDLEHNNIHSYTWSGEDVLVLSFVESMFNKIFEQLNDPNAALYYQKAKGKFSRISRALKIIVLSRAYHIFLILLVTSYLIALAVSSNLDNSTMIQIDLVYASIFTYEMLLKIMAFGWKSYLRDNLNKIDSAVVWACFLEIILLSNPTVGEYRYVRFLTAIKVFRIARVIQNIKFIKFLVSVINRTISSFIYLAILLILLNFVYALVGMEVFGGKISKLEATYFNVNFDTFWVAFLTVFNLVTLDNWIDLTREGFHSSVGDIVTTVFVISWIVIGNFLLLNLFLAILLDGFTKNMEMQELQEIIDEEQEEKEHDEYVKGKTQGRPEDLNIIIPKDARQGFIDELTKYFMYNSRYNEKYNEKETKLLTLLEMDIIKEKTQNSAYHTSNYVALTRIKCETSLWLWDQNSDFRKFCHKIIFHVYFQNLMIFTLCVCTFAIILQTYTDENNEGSLTLANLTSALDYICFAVFLIEAFLKIVVLGFYLSEKSYARSIWHRFDLMILIVYFFEFWLTASTQDYFLITKLLKMLKVLRPLSLINYSPNIYTVCKALWESTMDILKVLFVIFILWFTYALLGIILFRDSGKCGENNGQWQVYPYNFDNIYNAFITLFIISTYDGWNEIMSVAVNSALETQGPTQFNNQYSSYIFFLSFVIFGVMFLINLFTGVILYNFTMAEKMTKHKYLSDSQVTWINLHKLIILADPYFEYSKPPTSFTKRITFNIVRSKIFRVFIYLCLLANVSILLASYNNMSSSQSNQILYAHQIFNIIFLLEGVLQIFTFGFKGYLFDDWNKLSFFIICTAVCDFFLTFIWPSYLQIIRTGPQIVKGLRIVRMLRLIRVLRKRRGIDKLLHTLMFSLPMVLNIFAILMLIYYVYAMFGCYFFKGISIDEYINFKNFSYALMTLYKISTADGWEDVMMAISNYYSWAPLYFISFYIITTNVFINLLVLVLLQQFENYHLDPGNPIHTFKDYLLKFRKVWGMYTAKQRGKKIHHRLLIPFFQKLSLPMGFDEIEDYDIILKGIMEMKLICDHSGFITFNEVLYSTLKRAYHKIIYQKRNELAIQQLEMADEKTRFNLQMKKGIKKLKIRRLTYSPQEMSEFLKNIKEYNPLPTFFYTIMSFYSWRNYTDLVLEKLIQLNLKSGNLQKKEEPELSEYSEEHIASDSSSEEEGEDSKTDDLNENGESEEAFVVHNPSPNYLANDA